MKHPNWVRPMYHMDEHAACEFEQQTYGTRVMLSDTVSHLLILEP